MDKKIIGNWGEKLAKEYLQRKGYKILETNWRFKHKELDIIAFKDKLIGLEIKVRKSNLDLPFTVLKASQVHNLRQALLAYCLKNNFSYKICRLDLIVISPRKPTSIILHHYYDI